MSIENELNLLSVILSGAITINEIKIKPQHFTQRKTIAILKAIYKLHEHGKDINVIAVHEILKNKGVTLSELVEIASSGSLYANSYNTLENLIIDNYNRSLIKEMLLEAINKIEVCSNPIGIIDELANVAVNKVEIESNAITPIGESMYNTIDVIEQAYNDGGKITGMTTGYKMLDSILNGIERGNYIIIGARPGTGKSAFSLELARRLSKDNKVLFFSLEMSNDQLNKRLLSNTSRLNSYNLKTGKLDANQWENIMDQANKLSKLDLYTDDTGSLTVEELVRRATKFKLKYGLDVIIVDYLTKLDTEKQFQNNKVKVDYISEKLRLLCKNLNVAIIALSQVGREANGKMPTMSELRESGNIEQDAHIILLLHSPKDDVESGTTEILQVNIEKNRDGAAHKIIDFNYYKNTQIIDEKYS